MTPAEHMCDECGLTFFYDPKLHECAHKGDPRMLAQVEAVRGQSFADECLAKVRGEQL